MSTEQLSAATADLDPPLAALDLAALDANTEDLLRRAGGTGIRLVSKSVRCRWVLDRVLARPGFTGLMAYSLAEAIWLVRGGASDVLVGYPTATRGALRELAEDPVLLAAITLMVDDTEQLDLITATVGTPAVPIRVCLDVDASLRIGRLHLGVRRSPIRTPAQAAALAAGIGRLPGFEVAGVMFYEAQVAGLPDTSPAVALVKRRSTAELAYRRSAVVAAVRSTGAELRFVNSGGTGSIEMSTADDVVTEVSAGSGLYSPTLFDGYRQFRGTPAMFFALPVVRRPGPGFVTAFGGGYVASGPAAKSRQPRPVDSRLKLIGTEGVGEVQTPVRGAADRYALGDRLWFRHAKAGEMLERFDQVHVVSDGGLQSVPSYRGQGKNFG